MVQTSYIAIPEVKDAVGTWNENFPCPLQQCMVVIAPQDGGLELAKVLQ
jgi:hypothetical protein